MLRCMFKISITKWTLKIFDINSKNVKQDKRNVINKKRHLHSK